MDKEEKKQDIHNNPHSLNITDIYMNATSK